MFYYYSVSKDKIICKYCLNHVKSVLLHIKYRYTTLLYYRYVQVVLSKTYSLFFFFFGFQECRNEITPRSIHVYSVYIIMCDYIITMRYYIRKLFCQNLIWYCILIYYFHTTWSWSFTYDVKSFTITLTIYL